MTKDGRLTLWTGRDNVSKLHLLITDDDTIDQQLYQLPSLGKIQPVKRYLEPVAQRRDILGELDDIEVLLSLGSSCRCCCRKLSC
jgi:hypothetical protein